MVGLQTAAITVSNVQIYVAVLAFKRVLCIGGPFKGIFAALLQAAGCVLGAFRSNNALVGIEVKRCRLG